MPLPCLDGKTGRRYVLHMAEALTAESFFKEIRELFRETDRRMEQAFREIREMGGETDRRMQETDRRMQETDRRMEETDRKIKEVSVLVGNLGNRLGEFVENMVVPAVLRMFQERGIEVHQIFRNAIASRENEGVEVDILAVNGVELVATECKSKLSLENVDRHILRLKKIRRLFPQWADHRVYGAVATMVLDDDVREYAEAKGLFVISPNGDSVEIRNSRAFHPVAF